MGKGSSGIIRNLVALGRKGTPKDISDAAKNTNPHYSEGKEWQTNCQRCVFAYEMRRRGYDVEAKPRIYDGTDTLPYMNDPKGWPKVMKNAELIAMPSRKTIDKMNAQMAQWGDGARAVVRVKWKGKGTGGHVFIAEQKDGQTVYIDPQVGKGIDVNLYMNQAIKGETKLMRIDNLKPSSLISKCVKRHKKK